MSGNFKCTRCGEFFASLSLVGHEWVCGGCVSKAAGEREAGTQYRQGRAETPTPPGLAPAGSAETSTVSPVAAEASEYGWPKKGDVLRGVQGMVYDVVADVTPANERTMGPFKIRYSISNDADWQAEGAGRYRRIKASPTASAGNGAVAAEPDLRASVAPTSVVLPRVGSTEVGQGEMSDEAIYARWQEAAAARSGLSPAAFIAYVVRSEVLRATAEMLTREQVDQAWDDAGLARTFQHAKFMGCIDATLRGDP